MSRDLSPTIRRGRRQCWRAGLGLPLLLVWSLACSDSVGPVKEPAEARVTVKVTGVGPPEYAASPEGVSVLSCTVDLLASVKGAGTATWRGATFRWYPGTDLTTPFDSATLTSGEVGQSWGQSTIADGRAQTSGWIFSATVPFTVTAEYRYRFAGSTDVTTEAAQFTCQPAFPDNPSTPSITNFSLQPASGIIEPGDTLTIAYTATAEAGLWQSLVAVTGACDTAQYVPGHLGTTATTSVRVRLTSSCALGQPLSVSVLLMDAALKVTSAGAVAALTVQDLTPPVLDITFGLGGLDRVAAGDYFVGDTLTFTPYVSENHRLRTILWEVQPAGVTDSATPLPSSVSIPVLRLPIRSEWGSAVQLAFRARDEAGNTGPVVTINTDSLRLYPDVPRPTAWRIAPGDTRDVLPDSRRGVFYLLLANQRQLLTFSLADASLLGTLNLPGYSGSFDFTPSGDSLLLAYHDRPALGVLDLTGAVPQLGLHPLAGLDTAHGQYVDAVRTTANGKAFLHLMGPTLAQARLLELDLATGVETLRLDAGNNGQVQNSIERSPGHGFLVTGDGVAVAQLYSAATNQFGPLTPLSIPTGVFGSSTDGQVHAAGLQILDANLQLVRRVRATFGGGVPPSFLAPNGQHLYYVESRGLIRTRVSDGAVVERSRLPIQVERIRVSDDGQWAVYHGLPGHPSGQVGVIDLR